MRLLAVLKTIAKVISISVLCLLIAGVLTGFFYEKEIKQLLISEINKNIDTKIHVDEFSFSVIRHFPFASFELKNVMIEEVSDNINKDTLLYSKNLSLLFNITGLFNKDVSIKKVLVNNGAIYIRIDSSGHGNYRFWKTQNDSSATGVIDIEKILLKNVVLKFTDKKDRQNYCMLAKNSELSGKFYKEYFTLKTNADLLVYELRAHGINYVDHKPVTIVSGLKVNTKSGEYNLDDSRVKIADVVLKIGGSITDKASGLNLDLSVKSDKSGIANLINILPAEFASIPTKYKSKGNIDFSTTIKGAFANKNYPTVTVLFSVNDGSISAGNTGFEKIAFSGTFTNHGKNNKSCIDIPALNASIAGHPVQASIRLEDLPDAFLNLQAKTQINLKEIQSFIQSDTLESLSGDLAMNISYAGKVRELSNIKTDKLCNIKASGDIDISHVNFKLKKNPLEFKNMNGNFSLHNNDVYVKDFNGNISSTDFHVEGVFKNFISFLLIPGQPGEMQAKVVSKEVDLDELLVNKSAGNPGDTSYILKFNPRLICELDVAIGNLRFRKFSAGNIRGKVNLDRQIISGRGMQFLAMGGNVAMDATIDASRRDSVKMNFDTRFSKVDITRLFSEMENFDQQTMTDKNVKGIVTADVQFASTWSKDLTLNSKSVKSTATITVENGELNNFSPIQAMAKYIHAPDLNHIHFSTMTNNISISNRKIYIPNMDINSSAINIAGNGTHDFDNNVDYHIRLLLSDVIGKKVKSNMTEFGEVEDDGLGHTKLFLSMKGQVYDPHFSYDHKAVGEKIKTDIAREKENLKGMLKHEFSQNKNEPSVQTSKPQKHKEMQIDWSNE